MRDGMVKLSVHPRNGAVTVYADRSRGYSVEFVSRVCKDPERHGIEEFLLQCPHCDRSKWYAMGDDFSWPEECAAAVAATIRDTPPPLPIEESK